MVTGVAEVKAGYLYIAEEVRINFEKIVNTSQDADYGVKKITQEIQKMVEELKKVEEMSQNIAAIAGVFGRKPGSGGFSRGTDCQLGRDFELRFITIKYGG